ncbi:MAG: UvrD-helicase domain-containing protein [Thermoplasmata archaeon]
MTENTPNKQQRKLIKNTEGILLADAGPGTGKTFTISLRYAHLLKNKNVDPDDILLITFTNNAAENMIERIINLSDYEQSELRDAPISTFHSYCNRILNRYGYDAPKIIGIDDMITQSTNVIENEVLELQEFETFMGDFREKHPEYDDFYSILYDDSDLLNLIKSLGAKGIFPTKEGWFRNSELYLDGDLQEFKKLFKDANEPLPGAHGPKQSELRSRLTGYKNKCFLPDAPTQKEIKGSDKQIPSKYAELCFEEDRNELKQFVHDVYFEYIEYALSRNYLNFSFMMMLAFALLCEDHSLRKQLSFEYVMIDEFQDTNEIQFKLALLLSKIGNICVVGDWKQSIFSFQYASVENIIEFEERLNEFKKDLNTDYERVGYPTEIKEEIPLKKNYRSTQDIINFSEQGLLVEATKQETIDKDEIRSKITKLKSVNNDAQTEIGAYTGEDEKEVILSKITDIVDNPDYTILENDRERTIEYGDNAVLTRTRKVGLKLMKEAEDHNIPVAYEGGIELFRTRPSLILLAWLRIVQNKHSKRGWSLILDEAGYTLNEIEQIFKTKSYPDNLFNFRYSLEREETIGSLAKKIFDKYSIKNAFSDKIIETIQTTYDNTYFNRSDIINFIVENIESKQTYEVDSTAEDDVFKIQTIHSSKGLEYPVVILADMSTGGGGFGGAIEYKEPLGLRQNKIFSNEPYPYSYDNWKNYVMSKCLTGDYDEERRLLYVAMTRAENYLFLTAEKDSESEFFKNLSIEPKEIKPKIEPSLPKKEKRTELTVEKPKVHAPVKYSAHSIIDTSEFERAEEGLGMEYGTKVHRFAEMYAEGEEIEPTNQDEENVKRFIDSLEGELLTEKNCLLPLDIDDKRILFQGIIDLIHINDNKIQIIDFKTDRNKSSITEYRKQLSIYYKSVEGVYPKKNIESNVFYTENGNLTQIEPMNIEEIRGRLEAQRI